MDRQLENWFGFLFLGLVSAAALNAAEPPADIGSVLRNWETTSVDRGRDGATVRALQTIVGPVREGDLQKRFTWSRLSPTEIQAIPCDPCEQQFLPSVRVSLDESGLPQSVLVGSFRQDIRSIMRSQMEKVAAREAVNADNGIVRVSFNSERASNTQAVIAPRVSDVLTRWVKASKANSAVRATFERVDYDSATEIETHSSGTFVFTAPYSGMYRAQANKVAAADSARVGLDGQPYSQLPGLDLMLVWDNGRLTQVDVPNHRYEVHQLPVAAKELLCGGSFDAVWQTLIAPQSALPMVVALQEKELRSNYDWSLVSDDEKGIILHGTPVGGADAMLYQNAQIVIDPQTYQTRATRMLDITGTKETVHEFKFEVASADIAAVKGWQPDLSDYDRLGDIPSVEPASYVQDSADELPPTPPATLPNDESSTRDDGQLAPPGNQP